MFYTKDFQSCKSRMRKFMELAMTHSIYIVGRILWVFDNWGENCIIHVLIYKQQYKYIIISFTKCIYL